MRRNIVTGDKLPRFWELEKFAPRRRVLRVGLPGYGKSLLTVHDGLRCMAQGMMVWANFDLVHPILGLRAGRCDSWDAYRRVCELERRDKVVLLQEANLLCSSREFQKLPLWVHKLWAQSRHYGIETLMDAQHESRVDRVMREIVDYVVLCSPTGFRAKLGLPVYREVWCSLEQVAAVRSSVDAEVAGFESNAPVRGEAFLRWVPGWQHTAYRTHEILEPWRYDEEVTGETYSDPAVWDGSEWRSLLVGEYAQDDEAA